MEPGRGGGGGGGGGTSVDDDENVPSIRQNAILDCASAIFASRGGMVFRRLSALGQISLGSLLPPGVYALTRHVDREEGQSYTPLISLGYLACRPIQDVGVKSVVIPDRAKAVLRHRHQRSASTKGDTRDIRSSLKNKCPLETDIPTDRDQQMSAVIFCFNPRARLSLRSFILPGPLRRNKYNANLGAPTSMPHSKKVDDTLKAHCRIIALPVTCNFTHFRAKMCHSRLIIIRRRRQG